MVSQQETVEAMLERSGREYLPLRRSFVQRQPRVGGAGPLAKFVRHRRTKALDLYLLMHAAASAAPYDVAYPSTVWARALGLAEHSSAETLVSKTWTWLENEGLITTQRRGRLREVTLLYEDGSRRPYRHPGEQGAEERGHYFKLPYAYWHGGFQNRISLPAKAVLLIALSLRDDFLLPNERGSQWYGLSRDTVRKGLRDLRLLGLLSVREVPKVTPLTPLGITLERRYTLRGPFVREDMADATVHETAKRDEGVADEILAS
jgi:hypothetical protein